MATISRVTDFVSQAPLSVQFLIGASVIWLIYSFFTAHKPHPGFPVVQVEKARYIPLPQGIIWSIWGRQMILRGLELYPNKCFQVPSGNGYKIIVPSCFGEEAATDSACSLEGSMAHEFFIDYPGFEGFRAGLVNPGFLREIIQTKITHSLVLIMEDLVDELADACHVILGEDPEWHTCHLRAEGTDFVARATSRVFLGLPLCRNREWLRIATKYAEDGFLAAMQMRMCPGFLRPHLHWFIPKARRLRMHVADANRLILPEAEKRKKQAEEAVQKGEKTPRVSDALGWMAEISRGRQVDQVAAQLALSLASIHTTADTLNKSIIQLVTTPEIVQPMRDEVISVLKDGGWQRTTLYKLKKVDSFLKEVARLHVLSIATLNRAVTKPLTLPDGTTLPTGSRIMVSTEATKDTSIYADPYTFNAFRFVGGDNPTDESRNQYVWTAYHHLGFGHGTYACPGRFLAATELKIVLCFLLLQYDFRVMPGQSAPKFMQFEVFRTTPPNLKIQVRRRREEIDLMDPAAKA